MEIKNELRRIHGMISSQIGLDPIRLFRALWSLPRFVKDYVRFRAEYMGEMRLFPCLHDWFGEAGNIRSEYFWQDLYIAQKIYQANPSKHVDVGSRIDGFVAHVASFRQIEVLDIRPMRSTIPNVIFRQVDILNPPDGLGGYCNSLSCLHALEHFGLGRYGDPLDPEGSRKGFCSLARMLEVGGTLYLSLPCGRERVEFNGHRVFRPQTVLGWAAENNLVLQSVAVISGDGAVCEKVIGSNDIGAELKSAENALCLFIFKKGLDWHVLPQPQ